VERLETEMGGLRVRLRGAVGAGRRPEVVVVLCHGYGATGSDLVPLAGELAHQRPALAERVAFAFPEAPLRLADMNPLFGDARAWWHIEVGRYEQAMRAGRLDALMDEVPGGLGAARRKLRAMLEQLQSWSGLGLDRFVIGGFSQGSMLAADVALHLEEPPAALALLSSALIARPEWERLAPRRAGLRVLQAHGRRDELLPYGVAERLRDLLVRAGLSVDFVAFDDGHTITSGVVERLGGLIEAVG
jgi:phospholipase/carboxylesterase